MGGDRDTMTKQLSLAMDTTHNKKAPEKLYKRKVKNHSLWYQPDFRWIS